MSVATCAEPTIDIVVQVLAADFRQFVASLQRPRLGDNSWVQAVQRRCQELSERVGELRERLASRKEALPKKLGELRASLQVYSAEMAQKCSLQRLKEIRASLTRRYEDFVAQMRSAQIWGAGVRPRFRSLRLPKVARSVFHVTIGVTAVLLYQFVLTQRLAVAILLGLLVIFTALEVSRRFSTRFNDFMVYRVFGAISRPQERYKTNSATYYLVALSIITLATPRPAVCLAVLVLSFGDPTASLAGNRWGRFRLANDKSLIGCLAFFGVSLVATFTYLSLAVPHLPAAQHLLIAATISAVGALTELFCTQLDDNFAIPVTCALTGLIWF